MIYDGKSGCQEESEGIRELFIGGMRKVVLRKIIQSICFVHHSKHSRAGIFRFQFRKPFSCFSINLDYVNLYTVF